MRMDYELHITDMHCTACADSIQQFLQSEPGVEAAQVSYGRRRGTLTADPGTDVGALVGALEEMGYTAELVGEG